MKRNLYRKLLKIQSLTRPPITHFAGTAACAEASAGRSGAADHSAAPLAAALLATAQPTGPHRCAGDAQRGVAQLEDQSED